MVKYFSVLLLVIVCAAPAFAQDYPQIELGFGYGNLKLKDIDDNRHSGFATHQVFNLSSAFAIENYFGYYGMGRDPSFGKIEFLTNLFGARVAYRSAGPVIYGSAGLGGGWLRFPDLGAGTNSAFGVKIGGGVDIPINESFAWKVDASRMSFHLFDEWRSGFNLSTGIVINIFQ